MFIMDEQYCAVQTWFHDIPNKLTQATLYRYATEEHYLEHNNEISSEIFRLNYDSRLETLAGIEEAVKVFVEQIQGSIDEAPVEPPPVEEVPAEEVPVPVEQPPVEPTPVEEAPAPTEEPPAEEPPPEAPAQEPGV